MDKNIVLFLTDNIYTVKIIFYRDKDKSSPSEYTYISEVKYNVGDVVLVSCYSSFRLAIVKEIEGGLNIEPNSQIEYKWVVTKVDLSYYNSRLQKDSLIKSEINKSYKRRVREQFKREVLNDIDNDILRLVND